MGWSRRQSLWAGPFPRRGEGGTTEATQAIKASKLQYSRGRVLETSLHSSWLSDPVQGSCGRAGCPSRCGCAGFKYLVTTRRRVGHSEVPWCQYRGFERAASELLQKEGCEDPHMCFGQRRSLPRRFIRRVPLVRVHVVPTRGLQGRLVVPLRYKAGVRRSKALFGRGKGCRERIRRKRRRRPP
jgi:hypothetical protein